jgi:hypothetical protein
MDGRRMIAPGNSSLRGLFALGLGARILGARGFISANGRHLDELARACILCGTRCHAGTVGMQGRERLPAGRKQHTDQVDHHVGPGTGGVYRFRIAQVALHRHDLAGKAHRLQVACQVGPAHGNADTVALACQRAGDMTAQKAGTADDGDQFAGCAHAVRGSFRLSCSADRPQNGLSVIRSLPRF